MSAINDHFKGKHNAETHLVSNGAKTPWPEKLAFY